jgi:cysteine-rich repeat protein
VRWLVAVVAVVALAGCIHDDLVACADGRLCPADTACDVVHHSCVTPDQLTACEGVADLGSCEATGIAMGRCFGGVCLPAGCGNGEREPEELCDDGNLVGGDGCSADCLSREVCGDGFVDSLRGEQCDDGNTRTRDGCTNRCAIERPLWRLRLYAEPAARSEAGAAYDELAHHVVLFGGRQASQALDDTWALDGAGWSTLFAGGPIARESPAMAYDPVRHRVVLFGGLAGSGQGALRNDTWEWTGATWTRRTPATVPPARVRSAMVWDGSRALLFGGSQLATMLDDTWTWDGASWTRLAPAHAPSPREGAAMTYDAKHGRVVLFGGRAPIATTDTWAFDGTDWRELATIGAPPPLAWGALAYDRARGIVVLSGVEAATGNNVVWELDGAQWTDKTPDVRPAIAGGAVLVYDPQRGRVVQIGGRRLVNDAPTNGVWEWDGSVWAQRPRPVLPTARESCALASDPVRGRVVLFGGQGATVPLADTWEWDGRRWQPQSVTSPPARVASALAYHGGSGELVLFGGAGAAVFGDTWQWDGARWLRVATTGPAPRYGHGMAYDTRRDRIVLFGGGNGSQLFADLWQWDGATWTQLAPGAVPPPRMFSQLAYDIGRDRVVLFGGLAADGTTRLTDTWEWDGATWFEKTPPVHPEGRYGHSLVYDRMRARVVLYGGLATGFSQWEWDGEEWSQPEATLVPAGTSGACSTFDDARGELIAFGGTVVTVQPMTATGGYRGEGDEVCRAGVDLDGDGLAGCDDDDCRMVCAPLCWDDPTCTAVPRCGDGTCSALEQEAEGSCSADCP